MGSDSRTETDGIRIAPRAGTQPGLLHIFLAGSPLSTAHPTSHGITLTLGRADDCSIVLDHPSISRRHAEVSFVAGGYVVQDLGSRNGTQISGVRLSAGERKSVDAPAVMRLGQALFLLEANVAPFQSQPVVVEDGYVVSPTMRRAYALTKLAAQEGVNLLVQGETGTGKEQIARMYHALGTRPQGPFRAFNAAEVHKDTAEVRLFGALKGAYTGAPGNEGLIETAHGGTLFLDEIGDLELELQAKLLRAIETRTVQPLGARVARSVDFRLVCATHKDIAADESGFRRDLFMRIAQQRIELPPLRERRAEIPFLVAQAAAGKVKRVTAQFVEGCLLARWPGNVRDLLNAVRRGVARAAVDEMDELVPEDADVSLAREQRASASPSAAREKSDDGYEDDNHRRFVEEYRKAGGDPDAVMKALEIGRSTFFARKKKWVRD